MKTIIKDEVLSSNLIAIKNDQGEKITYKELAVKSMKLADYVEMRSLIFLLCDHHMETVEFLYEVLYLNAVPLLLSADINIDLLGHLIRIYRPQYIYCSKQYRIDGNYNCQLELNTHLLLKTNENSYEIHPDVAVLMSTSGTTGSAKLVKLSYDNLSFNAEQGCLRMSIDSGQKGLSPLSFSYVYGFCFYIWHWYCGATLLVTEESILSRKFSEFYIREKTNNFAGTPYIYQMLDRIIFWDEKKLKYLHWAMSAGTQMSKADQIRMVTLMGDKFWIMYGQTECAGIISGMSFDQHNIKLGAVGKVLDNMEAFIDMETNELILKGKSICMGYANDAEQLSAGDSNQGILRTGDIGRIDEDKCIYLKGRMTRYVKVLGKRVSLDDIETYLGNKIQGIEFACIGTDDHITVFHTGRENSLNRQISILLDHNMKIPGKFVFYRYVEVIPRNNAGKIQYGQLKEMDSGE